MSTWRARAETAEQMVADLIGVNRGLHDALALSLHEMYEAGLTATTAYRAAAKALAMVTDAES